MKFEHSYLLNSCWIDTTKLWHDWWLQRFHNTRTFLPWFIGVLVHILTCQLSRRLLYNQCKLKYEHRINGLMLHSPHFFTYLQHWYWPEGEPARNSPVPLIPEDLSSRTGGGVPKGPGKTLIKSSSRTTFTRYHSQLCKNELCDIYNWHQMIPTSNLCFICNISCSFTEFLVQLNYYFAFTLILPVG